MVEGARFSEKPPQQNESQGRELSSASGQGRPPWENCIQVNAWKRLREETLDTLRKSISPWTDGRRSRCTGPQGKSVPVLSLYCHCQYKGPEVGVDLSCAGRQAWL